MGLPSGTFNTSYERDTAIFRTKLQWALLIAAIILAFSVPFYAGDYLCTFLIYAMITIISTLGLMILTGYCGQFSLAHAAFMGVGAFTGANLMVNGCNFWLALVASGVVAGLTGVFFGLPSRKAKAFYLVLCTLAAHFIIVYVIIGWFGGDVGVHVPYLKGEIFGSPFAHPEGYYWLVLIVLLPLTYLAKNIIRTKAGRAFIAIRDNDVAAKAMGINIFAYKLLAFFVGCFYAGVAGCLWVTYMQLAVFEHFTLFEAVWYLGIIIVGGLGSIAGAYFGAIFIRGIKEISYIISPMIGAWFPTGSAIQEGITLSLPLLLFGIIVVLFIVFEPRGLAHRWEITKASGRLWPWGYW